MHDKDKETKLRVVMYDKLIAPFYNLLGLNKPDAIIQPPAITGFGLLRR